MEKVSAIAVLDVGKTNKKLILFDPDYRIILEETEVLPETTDEDGFPCEDLAALNGWLERSIGSLQKLSNLQIRAVNFSAYGASLVHIGKDSSPRGPLYNYLKPYQPEWRRHFEERFGSMESICLETASPDLGSLNSGLQLYRLGFFDPAYREEVSYALHLPNYLSWFFTKRPISELSSIGCHTLMWDFVRMGYHSWICETGLNSFLAPLHPAERPVTAAKGAEGLVYGTGLHDSSASLIPYLRMGGERFVVISTGTWSISLNPFNKEPLRPIELRSDCLSYLTPYGDQVKASRFFAGPTHDKIVSRVREFFHRVPDLQTLRFNPKWFDPSGEVKELHSYASPEEAYHHLMWRFVQQQKQSTDFSIGSSGVERLCVDGGFSRNHVYMQLLAQAYPDKDVFAAAVPQATSIGAAMILEGVWNPDPPAFGMVELKFIPRIRL